MGSFINYVSPSANNTIEISDWINLAGILINGVLAYWIVHTIQNKLNNKRILKDHFIQEVKDIRNEYKLCFNSLYSNNSNAQTLKAWFKLMNIKINDLMEILNEMYTINPKYLNPYQNDLRELITNNDDYIKYFNDSKIIFTEDSKSKIIVFLQQHNHLFTGLIVKINNS